MAITNIKLIKQQDRTGCGIACVAMVANRNYASVKTSLMKQQNWTSRRTLFYTSANQLNTLLKKWNVKSTIKKSNSWDDITGCAIVGVNRKRHGYFHWVIVIKDEKRFLILDPEEGEVYQGEVWKDCSDGFRHTKSGTKYIFIDGFVRRISI